MSNFSLKVDLLKLKGAFATNIKGKTATKQCLVIPIEDAHLFLGQKGCYLNLSAIAMQNSKFGDSHCIKQNLDKSVYEAMSETERQSMPIIGSVRPIEKAAPSLDAQAIIAEEEDMPF